MCRRAKLVIALGAALSVVTATALAADHGVESCCEAGTNVNTFTPKTLNVAVGDTVTWRNKAGGFHDVVLDDGSYRSHAQGDPTPWTVTRKFDAAGEFRYFCSEHGNKGGVGMSGTVIVGGGAPPPPPGGDTKAPSISSFKVAPPTFCNKKSNSCPKVGATIGFTLSEAATVDVTVLRRDTGDVLKTFSYKGKAGTNSFKYSGKGLPNGKYRLEATAVDSAKNRSRPAKASFKIAKRR